MRKIILCLVGMLLVLAMSGCGNCNNNIEPQEELIEDTVQVSEDTDTIVIDLDTIVEEAE